ncbi:MAG: hypothetical protein AABY22_33655 [Nanoarchaeota archaeon]
MNKKLQLLRELEKIPGSYTKIIPMRKCQDVSKFLRKFDEIQFRQRKLKSEIKY